MLFKKITAGLLSIMVVLSGNLFQFSASAEPRVETIPISAENFPDTIFRKYVSDTFDADKDAVLSPEEISSVTSVSVRLKGIQDLKGIEYFSNLKYLNAELNYLKTLDVSKNTKLESIIVANNRLTSIKLPNDNRNDTLVYLDVFANGLQELNVHNLFALGFIHADDNELTTLDLSDSPLQDGHGFVAMNNYLESITQQWHAVSLERVFDAPARYSRIYIRGMVYPADRRRKMAGGESGKRGYDALRPVCAYPISGSVRWERRR